MGILNKRYDTHLCFILGALKWIYLVDAFNAGGPSTLTELTAIVIVLELTPCFLPRVEPVHAGWFADLWLEVVSELQIGHHHLPSLTDFGQDKNEEEIVIYNPLTTFRFRGVRFF